MGLNQSFYLFLFFLIVGLASSSYISNEAFEGRGSVGRALLQQKASCTVDFEHMNYTVITSQCKGPHYTAEWCCPPLKQLICPEDVRDHFNDLKTNCADTFFSYVNLYGKYPPGLFASLCREVEQGLDCQAFDNAAANAPPNPNGAFLHRQPLLVSVFAAIGIFIFNCISIIS